jgi:hypothetical protein
VLTEDGMEIDESDEQWANTEDSIDKSAESDSNVTSPRLPQNPKQPSASLPTDDGILIDPRDR